MALAAQVSGYSEIEIPTSEAAFEDKVVLLMRRLCISSVIQNLNNSLSNARLKGSSLAKLERSLPYDLRIRSYSTLNKREKAKALKEVKTVQREARTTAKINTMQLMTILPMKT